MNLKNLDALCAVITLAALLILAIPSQAQEPNPLRDCLDRLDASHVSDPAVFEQLRLIESSRDIWLGYGVVGPRGYSKYDAPPPEQMRFRQLLYGLRGTGRELMSIWIGTSPLEPDEVYIFPVQPLNDNHGGGGCSFYVVSVEVYRAVVVP